jgi:hypothetical protein
LADLPDNLVGSIFWVEVIEGKLSLITSTQDHFNYSDPGDGTDKVFRDVGQQL